MSEPEQSLLLEAATLLLSGNASLAGEAAAPHLRQSLSAAWPALAALYGCLGAAGAAANAAVLWLIAKGMEDTGLVCNLAACNLVQAAVVLPATLLVLLLQPWVLGRALCYCLPMIQDVPLHVTTLTLLLAVAERHRAVLTPAKPRLSAAGCALVTWLLALIVVIPYPFYTSYVDLGSLVHGRPSGVGLCTVHMADSMQVYMRGIFLFTFVLPLTVTACLQLRISRELRARQQQAAPRQHVLAVVLREARHGADDILPNRTAEEVDTYGVQVELWRERRAHKYLVSMATAFAVCLAPLMLLRLVKLALVETSENSSYYDVLYALLVWVAFLHTCTTPACFAAWKMSDTAKRRLVSVLWRRKDKRCAAANAPGLAVISTGQWGASPGRKQAPEIGDGSATLGPA